MSQVATHVQKYFIKLANAGLPVPGRMPNLANYPKKKVGGSQRISALDECYQRDMFRGEPLYKGQNRTH